MTKSMQTAARRIVRLGAVATAGFALMLGLSAMAPSAQATTVLRVDAAQMTHTSDWIVRATVMGFRYSDERADGGGIFTDVDLSITEVLKGSKVPSAYTLRLIGGQGADGVTLKVPGMPTFRAGEDVVLFLEKTRLGHIPVGLGQGVWRVTQPPFADAWVTQSVGHVHMVQRTPKGLAPTRIMPPSQVRRLADLRDQVRFHLKQAPTKTQAGQ